MCNYLTREQVNDDAEKIEIVSVFYVGDITDPYLIWALCTEALSDNIPFRIELYIVPFGVNADTFQVSVKPKSDLRLARRCETILPYSNG